MKIRFQRLDASVAIPAYQTEGAAGFDLASREEITLPPKGHAAIGTGLAIATPPGHVLFLTARSSLFSKKKLMLGNGIGTIDSDYCGPEDELKLLVWNTSDEPVAIQKGERLAQGIILPIIRAEFEETTLEGKNRGGFGTTGGYQT